MSREISNDNEIQAFLTCSLCGKEKPVGKTMQEFQKIDVGYSEVGLQVWCLRHNVNIIHLDFEGTKHPANTSRKLMPGEKKAKHG